MPTTKTPCRTRTLYRRVHVKSMRFTVLRARDDARDRVERKRARARVERKQRDRSRVAVCRKTKQKTDRPAVITADQCREVIRRRRQRHRCRYSSGFGDVLVGVEKNNRSTRNGYARRLMARRPFADTIIIIAITIVIIILLSQNVTASWQETRSVGRSFGRCAEAERKKNNNRFNTAALNSSDCVAY